MNKQVFTGKTEEEAINKAMITLQETRDQLIVCNVDKQSGGLFKSPKVEVEIVTRRDIIDYTKKGGDINNLTPESLFKKN